MRLSPSGYLKFQACPRQYYFHYVEELRSLQTAINLVFGRAVHEAIEAFHRAEYEGVSVSIEGVFERAMRREAQSVILKESTRWDFDSLMATGRDLVAQFPEAWRKTGLMPVIDAHGPVIERRLEMRLPGQKDHLLIYLDILAMDVEGRIYLIDYKTPQSSSDKAIPLINSKEALPFARASDQLAIYQMVVEANARKLGIERVDEIGFMELIKRKVTGKKGPEIKPPQLVERRAEAEVCDLLDGLSFVAESVRMKRFPRFTGAGYNTPCRMCDFPRKCFEGDESGLFHQNQKAEAEAEELSFIF